MTNDEIIAIAIHGIFSKTYPHIFIRNWYNGLNGQEQKAVRQFLVFMMVHPQRKAIRDLPYRSIGHHIFYKFI